MKDILEKEEINDTVIEVLPDYDPINPREWDNIGHMICWHKKYALGDTKLDFNYKDYDSAEDLFNDIKKVAEVVLPLYLYDHSGISMSVGSFVGKAPHAEWDSGLVGYIYATKEDIDAAGIGRESTDPEDILRKEVEVYDRYLRGESYGFRAYKNVMCDHCGHVEQQDIDSCWGYNSIEEAMKAGREVL
jgi:hypothetical protein